MAELFLPVLKASLFISIYPTMFLNSAATVDPDRSPGLPAFLFWIRRIYCAAAGFPKACSRAGE
ncbi:MAG: hypothetical protein K2W95_24435 [Candidatus Obscuribacterales bacterium]|nr:hypothetical protein [Candidatus Obscuribacterales bacterium]